MLNLDYTRANRNDRFSDDDKALVILCSWFILNCLKRNYPFVDNVLAEIYFQTYGINTEGLDKKQFDELTTEYKDAIIRFFVSCQRHRCLEIINRLGKDPNFSKDTMIAIPSQGRPFFKEMLILDKELQTHNSFTKETQLLDSLRDTILTNSQLSRYISSMKVLRDYKKNRSNVYGNNYYIVSEQEFNAYVNILYNAVIDLYRPLFDADHIFKDKRSSYGLTESYEDSGTKFGKIIDYIKTLTYILCSSLDSNAITFAPSYFWKSITPEHTKNMFNVIIELAHDSCLKYMGDLTSKLSMYGGLGLNHVICLPSNTNVDLTEKFMFNKSVNSISYQFLFCQELINCVYAKQSRTDAPCICPACSQDSGI